MCKKLFSAFSFEFKNYQKEFSYLKRILYLDLLRANGTLLLKLPKKLNFKSPILYSKKVAKKVWKILTEIIY